MSKRQIAQEVISENTDERLINKSDIIGERLVYKIGIQAPPGTKFSINEGSLITMNQYGIYELDLGEGMGAIQSLRFKEGAYENGNYFPGDGDKGITYYNKIIVDMVYEDAGGEYK